MSKGSDAPLEDVDGPLEGAPLLDGELLEDLPLLLSPELLMEEPLNETWVVELPSRDEPSPAELLPTHLLDDTKTEELQV